MSEENDYEKVVTQGTGEQIDEIARPIFAAASPDFLAKRIETSGLLYELKKSLQGKTMNEEGIWIELGDPLMNDLGINVIISILIHYVSPNTLFSDLTRDEINQIMLGLSNDFRTALVSNTTEWDIKDIPLVKRAICDFVFITLKRAENRGEAKSIGQGYSINRTVVNTDGNRRSILPWRR